MDNYNKSVGIISEITNFSTHDGPGIRTTVFMMGCPLRCKWCSNPETFKMEQSLYYFPKKCKGTGKCQIVCPQGAIGKVDDFYNRIDRDKCNLCMKCVDSCLYDAYQICGTRYTVEDVFNIVKRDKVFYRESGGVTVSGGEPLQQSKFVKSLFKLCKEDGISTVLDTSGYGNTEELMDILSYTDLVLYDIKAMDDRIHQELTGVSNKLILENAIITSKSVNTRISFPLVPKFNDDKTNIHKLAEFAISNKIEWIDINTIHFLAEGKYRHLGLEPPYYEFELVDESNLKSIIDVFHKYGLKTTINRVM